MELLANCSLERSKTFNGKLSVEDEDGKDIRVSLNVVVDKESEDEIFSGLSGIEKCVTFVGNKATRCPKGLEGKVFNEYSLDTYLDKKDVDGVVNLLRVPNGFCDMKTLKGICVADSSIRVIGGKLLNIEGVRIGRFDSTKPVVCDGVYDTFIEADIDDLNGIKEKVKKAKSSEVKEKKSHSSKSSKGTVEKKTSKKVEAFKNMFGDGGESF